MHVTHNVKKILHVALVSVALAAAAAPTSAQLLRGRQGGNLLACITLPGNDPDGTVLHSATGGTVKTVYGTWSFGDYYVNRGSGLDPDLYPVLNGTAIENPAVVEGSPIICREMMVVNCGQLACLGPSSVWNGWSANSWQSQGDLSNPNWASLPPNQVTPPFAPSADGTSISGGTGSITSVDGVWTFGAPQAGGGWYLQLNGAGVNSRAVDQITINSHGSIWAHDVTTGGSPLWGIWLNHVFFLTFQIAGGSVVFGAPAPSSAVIPKRLVITPPSPNPPEWNGTLSATAATGTLIGTLTLYLSDGSTGSCGSGGVTCNVGGNNQGHVYATTLGNNVVMAINGVPDCGVGNNQAIPLSFTLNGVTVYKLFGVSPVGC